MTEFDKRKQEIQTYIKFLNNTEDKQDVIESLLDGREEAKLLRKVLFANTYLLLYNLVESSIRNSIQEIYDHFEQEGVSFDELNGKLKKVATDLSRDTPQNKALREGAILET
jgi:hypothetical protein